MTSRKRNLFRLAVIGFLIIASAFLGAYFHLVLKTDIIYTHFLYIPIVIASMWWGRRGIFVAALLAAVVAFFHLLRITDGSLWGDLLRMLFFIVVAVFVSSLREQVLRGQEALRSSEQRYRLLIEESPGGIMVIQEGRVAFTNRHLAQILSQDAAALVNRSVDELFEEESGRHIEKLMQENREDNYSDAHYEVRLARPEGESVWLDISCTSALYDGKTSILMHVQDISRRKEAESKRQELSDLARRQEEILVHSSRLAELGEMAAAISHELNQPLTGIRNYARNAFYMLENKVGGTEDVMSNLRLISDQVDRASKIINQMRELARRTELQYSPIDINGVIRESVEFLMPQMRLTKVDLAMDLDEGLPEIQGDWIRLEQVFLNLLTNARQAMEGHPVRNLLLKTGVDERSKDFVTAQVTDTGNGFTPEEEKKLFTPFYTTKKTGEGTGLGLAISLRIVKDHGGSIEACSDPGRGATFTIRLPVAGDRSEA